MLPELIAQSVESLSDDCRQRVVVEVDQSLREIGPVPVAGTALRLILQNLIINLADMVRDAGREQGIVRFWGEIRVEQGVPQLCLHCRDDGVEGGLVANSGTAPQGAAPRGASHQGIGLHWCANALRSLGGRMWATSEGPGSGATMHVVLPMNGRETLETESH